MQAVSRPNREQTVTVLRTDAQFSAGGIKQGTKQELKPGVSAWAQDEQGTNAGIQGAKACRCLFFVVILRFAQDDGKGNSDRNNAPTTGGYVLKVCGQRKVHHAIGRGICGHTQRGGLAEERRSQYADRRIRVDAIHDVSGGHSQRCAVGVVAAGSSLVWAAGSAAWRGPKGMVRLSEVSISRKVGPLP